MCNPDSGSTTRIWKVVLYLCSTFLILSGALANPVFTGNASVDFVKLGVAYFEDPGGKDVGMLAGNIELLNKSDKATAYKTTNESIFYRIDNTSSDKYTLRDIQQVSWKQITLAQGYYNPNVNNSDINKTALGNLKAPNVYSITGRKFNDTNGNGEMDQNESGLSGWRILLLSNRQFVAAAITNGSGFYRIDNIPAGEYTLTEMLQSGWKQTAPAQGHYDLIVNNSDITDMDFGNRRVSDIRSILGRKFNDTNGNGQKDQDETGLFGWVIELWNKSMFVGIAVTNESGFYSIDNIPSGNYTLIEVLQKGWKQTAPSQGYYNVTVNSSNINGMDFGNQEVHSITGRKFNDLNGNGSHDSGSDPGIPGWRIELINESGQVVATAITNESGMYRIDNVTRGNYTVREEHKPGWNQTYPASGNYPITVGHLDVNGMDFGNLEVHSISGLKFNDLNGNGTHDGAFEPGLPGWRIELINESSKAVASVITNESGMYRIDNITRGNYTLREILQNGWKQTTPALSYYNVTVNHSDVNEMDFGNQQVYSIFGRKFNDTNGNGQEDQNETGLAGWVIQLWNNSTFVNIAVTNESGFYSIDNIPSGNYTLREMLQAGWKQTAPALGYYNITVNSSDIAEMDFGNQKVPEAYSIAGRKFNDTNGNGQEDQNESGLAGWEMQLLNKSQIIATATTNESGFYRIDNVSSGNYTLNEVLQAGWKQTAPAQGYYNITVNSSDLAGMYFGNQKVPENYSITGRKFNDINGNGQEDLNESGLAGWEIELRNSSTSVAIAVTNESGFYSIGNITSGNYTLREVLQNGWIQTAPTKGYYNLTMNNSDIDKLDFGNQRVSENYSITGRKFNDTNGNGQEDLNESGLPGWEIEILNKSQVAATAVTNESGFYRIDNITSGNYTLREIQQADWMQTFPDQGYYNITVNSSDIAKMDFGNQKVSENYSIAGRKFNDINGNGQEDQNESGLAGWEIELLNESNQTAAIAVTNESGFYRIDNISSGNYTLREVLQAGWEQTTPALGYYNITVNRSDLAGVDFGNQKVPENYSITGRKFNDINGNGQEDLNESGLAGWEIELRNSSTSVAIAVTNESGFYSIGNITSGNYTLREVLQDGWNQTFPAQGYYNITVNSSDITKLDFGNQRDPEAHSIAGRKFNDTNGNGQEDQNELGLAGWEIQLLDNSKIIATAITNESGFYKLDNISSGNYTLREVLQAGWEQTAPALGYYNITMNDSDLDDTDFGNQIAPEVYSITGLKFNDTNGNGLKDLNESGLSDWEIELVNEYGQTIAVAVTNESGLYRIDNISAGNYTMREVLQNGWIQTFPSQGHYNITVNSSDINEMDFGNQKDPENYSITGQKFNDTNGNCLEDQNEPGLSGWEIELINEHGQAVANAVTNESGFYRIDNISSGNYTLREVQQTGWMQTMPVLGYYNITMNGSDIADMNFGNQIAPEVHSITGMKFNDTNGNGLEDQNESGLAGWEIELLNNSIVIASAATNESGFYRIDNIPSGKYTLKEISQAGWTQTSPVQGYYAVTIDSSDLDGMDFGNQKNIETHSITGIKFNDTNGNGQEDLNETGLSDWEIQLINEHGQAVATAVTNESGFYRLDNIYPGNYTLKEVQQAGWIPIAPAQGYYNLTVNSSDLAGVDFGNQQVLENQSSLNVTKVANPTSASPGAEIGFDIKITNNGETTLSQVKAVDTLPTGMSYVSDNRSGSVSGRIISWDSLGNLVPGNSTAIHLVGRIDPKVSGILTNVVNVTAVDSEGRTLNSSAIAEVQSLIPEINVTKTLEPVQYGQYCEAKTVKGNGTIASRTNVVDKEIALKYNNALAGEGEVELESTQEMSEAASKFQRVVPSSNGTNKSSLNFFEQTKLGFRGSTPLTGEKSIQSMASHGGSGAKIQEAFSTEEIEKNQTVYLGSNANVTSPHSVGMDLKSSFSGTVETNSEVHKTMSKSIKSRQLLSGKFDLDKMVKINENATATEPKMGCEGIDC